MSQGEHLWTKCKDSTWGSISIDIKRPYIDQGDDRESLLRRRVDSRTVRFSSTGIRFKVMRHVGAGPSMPFFKHGKKFNSPILDFGIGTSFEVDSASFQPKLRVKVANLVSLVAFPEPGIKIQKRIPIGLTGYALRCSYFCAMEDIATFYQPPAKLLITLDSYDTCGVKLSQAGLELSGNTWLGPNDEAYLQASAVVHLPNSIPFDMSNNAVSIEPRRCGLKLRW